MAVQTISLFELNKRIKDALNDSFPGSLWVRAEIAELREHGNGHCYLDLVEKDENSNQVVARVRATIWSYTYRTLKAYFESVAKRPLSNGIKVLVQGSVEFQELYGLSFNIKDIDPAYSLGDLEQKRLEVIRRLKEEGVLNMNKELPLPIVPQKIAIISSPTAAGYGDFVDQLVSNSYGIKFYYKLFPAIMQGDKAPESIVNALEKIHAHSDLFDIVAIIRGGGASLDLLCFDDYWLSYNVAQFTLPVISGIGHERDVSVVDMVAHTSAKTPTAVAEFIISGAARILEQLGSYGRSSTQIARARLSVYQSKVERYSYQLHSVSNKVLTESHHYLTNVATRLPGFYNLYLQKQGHLLKQQSLRSRQLFARKTESEAQRLQRNSDKLQSAATAMLKHAALKLDLLERNNRLNDPVEVLKRGFSITRVGGMAIKTIAGLKSGDVLETEFRDGKLISEVKSSGQFPVNE